MKAVYICKAARFSKEIRRLKGIKIEGKLVAYHAAGVSFLPGVPVYGTASSIAYNTAGGDAGLVSNFEKAFGESRVKAEYPDYSGLNYLDMTVNFFFPAK